MTELIHSLGIEWPVLVAQIVNFAILLAVLGRFVYKPVMKMLDERGQKVADTLARDKHSTEKLHALEAERAKMLAEARIASQKIIDEAKQDGEGVKKKMLDEARGEVARLRLEEDKRRVGEKARLVAEARRELGAIVVEAVERSLGDVLDARAQGKMVEQALAAIREGEGEKKI